MAKALFWTGALGAALGGIGALIVILGGTGEAPVLMTLVGSGIATGAWIGAAGALIFDRKPAQQ